MARKDYRMRFKTLPNGNIRGYMDDGRKSGVSEAQFTSPDGVSGTVTTSGGGRKVYFFEEKEMEEGIYYKGRFVRDGDGLYTNTTDGFFRGGLEGVSRTVKAEKHDAAVCVAETDDKVKISDMDYKDRIISKADPDGWFEVERTFRDGAVTRLRKRYRIRKLSPRECFRLMGVSDGDFDRMKAVGISDSQLYKLAGNSIVVPVLEALFTRMLEP